MKDDLTLSSLGDTIHKKAEVLETNEEIVGSDLGAVTDQWDAHCVADNDDDETVGLF
jgi:hypothetical protein